MQELTRQTRELHLRADFDEARDCARFALTDCEWCTLGNGDDLARCLERSGWGGQSVDEVKAIIDTRRGPNRDAFDGPRTEASVKSAD